MATTEMKRTNVSVGAVDLHVVELGAGKPVLFCHGFPDVWIGWRRQMEAVAAAGYRAIAFDSRGYGRSSGPDDPLAYTPYHTIGDIVGLLDVLDLPQAAVVGHDFGAGAAWYAGLLRADRFPALFAISVPFVRPGNPSYFELMARAGQQDAFYMFQQRKPEADLQWADARTSYPGFLYWSSGSPPLEDQWDPCDTARPMWRAAPVPCPPWADPADVSYAIREFERTGFGKPLNSYRSLQAFFDLAQIWRGRKLECPAFFLAGERDGIARLRPYDEPAMRQDVPNLVGFRVLANVGHWPHREAADVTNELLVTFLKQAY